MIFALKLKTLKFRLKAWSKTSVRYFKEMRRMCIEEISKLNTLEEDRSLSKEERKHRESLRKEFQIVAVKEEVFWRQRSRIRWLKEGDHNSKLFHKVASQYRKINDV